MVSLNLRNEIKTIILGAAVFGIIFFLPLGSERFQTAVFESLHLLNWYAREHFILCLIPALFIAGAIAVFLSEKSVIRYLGPTSNRFVAYLVASVSGSVLAVCSCTVLPLFAGIYRMGAGLGPAAAFLYSGPAINVMAIILTARILGPEIGIARALGAVIFSIAIGLLMQFIFRAEKKDSITAAEILETGNERPLAVNLMFFAILLLILVFSNLSPSEGAILGLLSENKWLITGFFAFSLSGILIKWFGASAIKTVVSVLLTFLAAIIFPSHAEIAFITGIFCLSTVISTGKNELKGWFRETFDFGKQIIPLLFWGILIAGFLLGRPGNEGIVPSAWVQASLGGNGIAANLFASVAGAFMYFATLTEIPIVQGLVSNGMGKGPSLALLLSGPALSLPNMLVIGSILGTKKTVVYILLVIVMSTISGIIYGNLF